MELDELATLPVGVSGRTSLGSKVGTSSVQTSALSAGRSQTSHFTVLVSGLADPVNSRVVTDGTVVGVNHDDLEPLVNRVLTNPVRVQHSQGTALATGSLLSNRSKVSDKLLLSDTGVLGLSVVDTLRHSLLSVTSLDTDSVDHEALLSLVSQAVSLIGTRGLSGSVDRRELSVLPGSDSENESHDIRLLLGPKLLQILVCSH